MVDKLSDLLFHPKTLKKYKNIHILKALAYILIIGILSYLVTFIDVIIFDGYTVDDREEIEQMLEIDFSIVDQLPDCKLENESLTCDNPDDFTVVGKGLRFITFVFDENENYEIEGTDLYIIFTKDSIKYANQFSEMSISYEILPSKWQSFDLSEIKDSDNPEKELTREFIGGFNQIIKQFTPLAILILIPMVYFAVLFETLFISFLFYIFYRRYPYRYRDIFKVTVFAQTFPVIVGLMMTLMGIDTMRSLIVTTLTFIYVYKALISNLITKIEN